MEDMENRVFVLVVSMDNPLKGGNSGELQNLFDEGWVIDFVSDKMPAKNGDYVMVVTLERDKLYESNKK